MARLLGMAVWGIWFLLVVILSFPFVIISWLIPRKKENYYDYDTQHWR